LSLAGRPGRAAKNEYNCSTYATTRMVCEDIFETQIVDGKPVTVVKKVCKPVQEQHTRKNAVGVEWEEPGTVLGVAFSGDGRSLAAACEDGSALVWDAETCQPHDTARWPDGTLRCVASSPDGKLLATAGDSGEYCQCTGLIRIFDAVTGRLTRTIETSAGPV